MKTIITIAIAAIMMMMPISGAHGIIINGSFLSSMSYDRVVTVYPAPVMEADYNNTYYNDTTPETVRAFMAALPRCPWFAPDAANMCSLSTSYTVMEAETHGLDLHECILHHVTGVMGGHSMPSFVYEGSRYYCTNLHSADDRVVNGHELHIIMKERKGIDRYRITT